LEFEIGNWKIGEFCNWKRRNWGKKILLDILVAISGEWAIFQVLLKGKGEGHACTGTEALYRPYGP